MVYLHISSWALGTVRPKHQIWSITKGGEATAEVHPECTFNHRSTIMPMMSYLGAFLLHKRSTPQWQEQKETSLAYFVYELRKCKALDLHEEDPFTSGVAVLEQALRGADTLAKALVDVWQPSRTARQNQTRSSDTARRPARSSSSTGFNCGSAYLLLFCGAPTPPISATSSLRNTSTKAVMAITSC